MTFVTLDHVEKHYEISRLTTWGIKLKKSFVTFRLTTNCPQSGVSIMGVSSPIRGSNRGNVIRIRVCAFLSYLILIPDKL